jgi:hypothetical protein
MQMEEAFIPQEYGVKVTNHMIPFPMASKFLNYFLIFYFIFNFFFTCF